MITDSFSACISRQPSYISGMGLVKIGAFWICVRKSVPLDTKNLEFKNTQSLGFLCGCSTKTILAHRFTEDIELACCSA